MENNAREELIHKIYKSNMHFVSYKDEVEELADFILADRKAIVEKVVEPLKQRKTHLRMDGCSCHIDPPCEYCVSEISADDAIDESLKIAEEVVKCQK